MEPHTQERRPVRILDERVARKIAAGEVIDRPAAVVREFMDNAIDAGSSRVEIHIEEGGIRTIRSVDDGRGMSREDLELCVLPHATSKITHEDDLLRVTSLGFRGEALSSIGTVSRLSITSKEEGPGPAHRIVVRNGRMDGIEECLGNQGTIAEAADLFFSYPARKKFLKRAAAETTVCRNQFIEKALPFPETAFRFFSDGSLRTYLPASDPAGRIAAAFPEQADPRMLREIGGSGDGFILRAVAGRPELARKDRKFLHVYVNRRRVTEYALLQAVQYAYGSYLPGGRYPVAFLFLDIDPQLADFNIHPAKREVRLRNLQEVHHRIVEVFGSFLSSYALRVRGGRFDAPGGEGAADRELPYGSGYGELRAAPEMPAEQDGSTGTGLGYAPGRGGSSAERQGAPLPRQDFRMPERPITFERESAGIPFRYIGQVFGLFLAAELDDGFYLVDQHAAHERILFDRLRSAPRVRQPLLVPHPVEPEGDEEDRHLAEGVARFADAGIELESDDAGGWRIVAVPEPCAASLDAVEAFLRETPVAGRDPADALYATMACRAAVKDGDRVDPLTAVRIIRDAFALPDARCPHGRPIWHRIDRGELFRLVGRE